MPCATTALAHALRKRGPAKFKVLVRNEEVDEIELGGRISDDHEYRIDRCDLLPFPPTLHKTYNNHINIYKHLS